MRDIKFRAWIKEKKRLTGSFGLDDVDCGFLVHLGGSVGPEDSVMQYTGLKDANGVEIYEGDIVSLANAAPGYSPAVIDYAGATFGLSTTSTGIENWEIEIIGNLYENPELLEGIDDDN